MDSEVVKNKIVDIPTILKIAEYLEKELLHYRKLYMYNDKLNYYTKEDINVFHKYSSREEEKVEYSISFADGTKLKKSDYNWFKSQLNTSNRAEITGIGIYCTTYSTTNLTENKEFSHNTSTRTFTISIRFYEYEVTYNINGENMEDEVFKYHNDIKNFFDNCPNRYDKTIKRKLIRKEFLALSVGFIFGYIAVICTLTFKNKFPDVILNLLNNNYSYVVIFYIISFSIGNIIATLITDSLYKGFSPKKKYSHYSSYDRKSVYVDDITKYIDESEVQIGKYANSLVKRAQIESLFKKTSIIVLVQIIITIIVCLFL